MGNGEAGKKNFRPLQSPAARAFPHPRARSGKHRGKIFRYSLASQMPMATSWAGRMSWRRASIVPV